MNIDLNNAFPLSEKTSTRGPLPKQRQFLDMALDQNLASAKYIAYVGGVGSGKTLIGCITILTMAILHPGDYLICRQFAPELKITTLKTFLEVCPKELIAEHRIADGIVKVKALGGKFSSIIFRQLEEPDKLRSLNLSGFLIDEANQVSEEAFLLLQGRLRGKGLRKGLIVSNPNGHDWLYKWFVKKDHIAADWAKNQLYLFRAPSAENIHLPDGYIDSMLATWSSERIQREIEGSFDAFEGAVYQEFRRDVHVIKPFRVPEDWPRHIRIDHGYRNPACFLWAAVSGDGDVYIYRELYEREWLIHELINGDKKQGKTGALELMGKEKPDTVKIDPSTRARRGTNGQSDYDEYIRHWPSDFPFHVANNEKTLGIDRVKSYLKLDPKTGLPRLFIFETCGNLIEEISQYRYRELPANQQATKDKLEEPVKINDHAVDALRYLIVDLPDPYEEKKADLAKSLPYNSSHRNLFDELKEFKKPVQKKDPFGDGI